MFSKISEWFRHRKSERLFGPENAIARMGLRYFEREGVDWLKDHYMVNYFNDQLFLIDTAIYGGDPELFAQVAPSDAAYACMWEVHDLQARCRVARKDGTLTQALANYATGEIFFSYGIWGEESRAEAASLLKVFEDAPA